MGLSFSGGWSQSGLLGGTGTVQLGAGFDGNVWRIPVQAAHPFSASQSDGFTALQAQWNRDAVRGVNHWVLHASGFAKKHAVQSGANAHRVEFGAKLLHRLNERVRGDLGLLLVEQQQLEVHWEDNEQWSSMGRMDVQSFACMNFELKPAHSVGPRCDMASLGLPSAVSCLLERIIQFARCMETAFAPSSARLAQIRFGQSTAHVGGRCGPRSRAIQSAKF